MEEVEVRARIVILLASNVTRNMTSFNLGYWGWLHLIVGWYTGNFGFLLKSRDSGFCCLIESSDLSGKSFYGQNFNPHFVVLWNAVQSCNEGLANVSVNMSTHVLVAKWYVGDRSQQDEMQVMGWGSCFIEGLYFLISYLVHCYRQDLCILGLVMFSLKEGEWKLDVWIAMLLRVYGSIDNNSNFVRKFRGCWDKMRPTTSQHTLSFGLSTHQSWHLVVTRQGLGEFLA